MVGARGCMGIMLESAEVMMESELMGVRVESEKGVGQLIGGKGDSELLRVRGESAEVMVEKTLMGVRVVEGRVVGRQAEEGAPQP